MVNLCIHHEIKVSIQDRAGCRELKTGGAEFKHLACGDRLAIRSKSQLNDTVGAKSILDGDQAAIPEIEPIRLGRADSRRRTQFLHAGSVHVHAHDSKAMGDVNGLAIGRKGDAVWKRTASQSVAEQLLAARRKAVNAAVRAVCNEHLASGRNHQIIEAMRAM